MSEQGSFWIKLLERLFGVIIIFVAGLIMYYAFTSPDLGNYVWLFAGLNTILVILGLVLVTAKTE